MSPVNVLWHNLPAIELVADILLPSSVEPSDWNTSDSDNPSQQSFVGCCGVGVGVFGVGVGVWVFGVGVGVFGVGVGVWVFVFVWLTKWNTFAPVVDINSPS